jgi:RNA polymerase sigma-70 factor (ECF subfamily)
MTSRSDPQHEVRLLERVRERDRDAFEELYRLYAPRLFGYLLRVTRRPEVVEEVVDEVLLTVWRQAGQFEGRSRPSTWIFGIAYRKAMRALRRQRRRPETDPLPPDLRASTEGPEGRTIRRERAEMLSRALAELSPDQRAVIELTYYQGFSCREAAEALGCPEGTVKTRMYYARRRLSGVLDSQVGS